MGIFRNDDIAKFVLRLTVGILMLFHGVAKLTNLDSINFIKSTLENIDFPSLFAYGVYVGEIVAPILIIIGVYTRFGALLIVINMIFAIVLVHSGDLFRLTEHGGWRLELQAFYLFCSVAILFFGSGKMAVKPD